VDRSLLALAVAPGPVPARRHLIHVKPGSGAGCFRRRVVELSK
jgi:hypothetical protein